MEEEGCFSAIDDRVATISFKNNISAGRKFRGQRVNPATGLEATDQ